MLYLVAFCSRPEAAGDVISGRFVRPIVSDKSVKLCYPRLNCSPEIQQEAAGGGIFDRFSNFDKCKRDVAGDFVSSMAVGQVGVNVAAKFGDYMLSNGRIIRLLGWSDAFHALFAVFNCILQPTGSI